MATVITLPYLYSTSDLLISIPASTPYDLKEKTDEQIFKQDYKKFTLGKLNIGIGQISSLNEEELSKIQDRLIPYMDGILSGIEEDMIFLMLTNILKQETKLICIGNGAGNLACDSFNSLDRKSVV